MYELPLRELHHSACMINIVKLCEKDPSLMGVNPSKLFLATKAAGMWFCYFLLLEYGALPWTFQDWALQG